jgi:hypothetical protein
MPLERINQEEEVKMAEASKAERRPVEQKAEEPRQEKLNPRDVLNSFENNINPDSIISVEKKYGYEVLHCNNSYEYLHFAFPPDGELKEDAAKIEKYKEIFQKISSPDTMKDALKLINTLDDEEKKWLFGKIQARGSGGPVKMKDGKMKCIVIMNDMPTLRKFNQDGSERNEARLKEYDEDYARILEHELRHAQFYTKYGKDREQWKTVLEGLRPLTPLELKRYHLERFTIDEIAAHMENDIRKVTIEGKEKVEVKWQGIINNLMKDDYRRASGDEMIFESEKDLAQYKSALTKLVGVAREEYEKTGSISQVMDKLASTDVTQYLSA